jgi:hypothetical protein
VRRRLRYGFRGWSSAEVVVFGGWCMGVAVGVIGALLLSNFDDVAARLGKRRLPLDFMRGRGSYYWRAFGLVALILGASLAFAAD